MLTALCGFCLTTAPALGQIVDHPGFRALPRPVRYETPLTPSEGPRAIIVYGRVAPETKRAAEAVQKAIAAWSGHTLALADDREVTSEATWLLRDAYRQTPLIVLGNAQNNRVMHALATRFLLRSNRTWPGGDRYIIRTVVEPFVVNVNYLLLEASTEAGLNGAVSRLAELLQSVPEEKRTTATLPPRLRVVAAVQDRWPGGELSWKPPAEWTNRPGATVAELIGAFQGAPILAGTPAGGAGLLNDIHDFMLGGRSGPTTCELDLDAQRRIAAMVILGCRAQGGRTHGNFDHYGALHSYIGIRSVIQSGVLTDTEVQELESCIVLSTALPLDYVYNTFGRYIGGNRHHVASLLSTAHATDYILGHCRMDEKTRQEIERRDALVRKSAAYHVRSFRDSEETDCQGENTLMQCSTLLHQGLMDYVRHGYLRLSADFYILSVDNMPGLWGCGGQYVGLSGFTSGPGGMLSSFFGGGLVEAAAFYYDDPQYRWLANNWADIKWSRGGGYLPFHTDTVGPMEKPVVPMTYDGVRALPYDEGFYAWLTDPTIKREEAYRLPPESLAKAVDRLAFRDDFNTNAAFLFLATSSNPRCVKAMQNNMIARFTDLGEIWLFTNIENNSGWSRNVVSISNGRLYQARTACTLDALMNLGEISASATRDVGVAGTDWTRTIVHWRGHYFAVLDRMEARPAAAASAADDYSFVCRWRCPHLATLENGVWTAVAPSGSRLHVLNTDPIVQTSAYWPIDGAARPYVLEQYKRAKLAAGQAETFLNLLYVSGTQRPDEFTVRRAGTAAMLVKGRTQDGEHLALIGLGNGLPLPDLETDALICDVAGNEVHLAEATTLRARVGGAMREVFRAAAPVNLRVNCLTGQGEIEVRGTNAVDVATRGEPVRRPPGRHAVVLADAGALPETAAALEALWSRSAPTTSAKALGAADVSPVFQGREVSERLRRPLRRLTNAGIGSTPAPNYTKRTLRIWNNTDNLEITITLPEPTAIGCLRLVAVNQPPPTVVGRNPTGAEWLGTPGPTYAAEDFAFTAVLSNDGFQNDVRPIERPQVTTDWTAYPPAAHSTMQNFLTWRIELNQTARQVRLLPRAKRPDRAKLALNDIEVYGAAEADDLAVHAFAADLNGDGGNELVIGTSERELAAFDADGKLLWRKHYPSDILRMVTADLEDDGKAEVIAYLTNEEMHRVNGDGTERQVGDILQAEKDANHGCWGVAGASAIAVWAPDGADRKEVLMLAEYPFRVVADGSVKPTGGNGFGVLGCGRLVGLYPNEPEVLALVRGRCVELWAGRRDQDGRYIQLGSKPQVAGPDGGTLGWAHQVDVGSLKGFLTAYQGGVNYYPAAALAPNSTASGWEFGTGGVPAIAALAEDFTGDGVPEIFLGRLDGFVNVLNLADGKELALLNAGEPIVGLVALRTPDGKRRLAVGTKFGVHLLSSDFKLIGKQALQPVVAFVGPGGKKQDRAFVVNADGKVTVLILK